MIQMWYIDDQISIIHLWSLCDILINIVNNHYDQIILINILKISHSNVAISHHDKWPSVQGMEEKKDEAAVVTPRRGRYPYGGYWCTGAKRMEWGNEF